MVRETIKHQRVEFCHQNKDFHCVKVEKWKFLSDLSLIMESCFSEDNLDTAGAEQGEVEGDPNVGEGEGEGDGGAVCHRR